MCCSYRHQHFLNYHLFCCADSPRNYKCKDDVGLWNGDLIDRLKLRPPLNDVDAAARCRAECNKRDGVCAGVSGGEKVRHTA